jgi:hypothetical protein
MFDLYDAVKRLRAVKGLTFPAHMSLLSPAHYAFIDAARSGALGWSIQQLCSANPYGGLFLNRKGDLK